MTEPEDLLAVAQTGGEAARASRDVVLEVDGLTVAFPTDDGLVQAVRGVSYQLRQGEVLGIVGESGSGKSVTSMAVMGLLPGSARVTGSVRFGGQELLGAPDAALAKVRGRRIAMIFQDPMTSLNPVYTVGYQIAEAVRAHHDVSKDAALKRAGELLEIVRIPNAKARLGNYPHELSGGMRQRVVIAIAMANDPDVIIADEPTTALDVTVQAQILDLVAGLQSEHGTGVIWITHDLGVVAGIADRVLVMYGGRCVEDGTVDDVLERPAHPYTRGLLGALPDLAADDDGELATVPGVPPAPTDLPPGCVFWPRCPVRSDPRCETEQPPLAVVGASNGLLPHRAATWCEEGRRG